MGKIRVKTETTKVGEGTAKGGAKSSRKRLDTGVIHIEATYNNTKLALSDAAGNIISWSSSGSLGFKGAKKGTPFAAAKVGEHVGDFAKELGVREVGVIVKGVGAGRESAIRSFVAKSGAVITFLEDRTPLPFNGPRPKKPRRV
ncbi:MAG: 30S ribosomal protein S11 [Patescibacteria group bacterium]